MGSTSKGTVTFAEEWTHVVLSMLRALGRQHTARSPVMVMQCSRRFFSMHENCQIWPWCAKPPGRPSRALGHLQCTARPAPSHMQGGHGESAALTAMARL